MSKIHALVEDHENEYLEKLKVSQAEITKQSILQMQGGVSKSQQKKYEKSAQQTWSQVHIPNSSMNLHNAVMYL